MIFLFNLVNSAFYAEYMLDDGSYGEIDPSEFIRPTDEELGKYHKTTPPAGKQLGVVRGRPGWVDLPPLSDEEKLAQAENERIRLRTVADAAISWRQDAVDAEIATDDEKAALAAWRKYRVLLMRVDTAAPEWPTPPEFQAI